MLELAGWRDDYLQSIPDDQRAGLIVGRITQEQKIAFMAVTERGEFLCSVSGKMRHDASGRDDLPAVGDWCLIRAGSDINNVSEEGIGGQIVRLLPRKALLARSLPTGEKQILASNVDYAFLLTALNSNYNERRMERYLSLVRGTSVTPVLLLSKADLVENPEECVEDVQRIAPGVAVHAISSINHYGFDIFKHYLKPGVTGVMLGSSGVGKSTLINHLADADIQDMMEAREFDDKGRHCTTFRNLILLPEPYRGVSVIDTPGMRALGLGEAEEGLISTFEDVEALTLRCRFTNCTHVDEPGCKVREAIEKGELERDRWLSYDKLQKEIQAQQRKQHAIDQRKERQRAKGMKERYNDKKQR